MPAHAMNHFTILTKDVAATQDFYSDILGLKVGYRPPISRPGAWMYAGEQAVLHVIDPIEMPQNPNGVLDHMAFSASGLGDVAAKLKQRGVRYELSQQGETGTWQMFFLDLKRCLFAILPPSLLWGASFPLACAAAIQSPSEIRRSAGWQPPIPPESRAAAGPAFQTRRRSALPLRTAEQVSHQSRQACHDIALAR